MCNEFFIYFRGESGKQKTFFIIDAEVLTFTMQIENMIYNKFCFNNFCVTHG